MEAGNQINTSRTSTVRDQLVAAFEQVRATSEAICQPLEIEDFVVQPIDDVSPAKWHLGHTTWFYEQVILDSLKTGYQQYRPGYFFVFNSYYDTFGQRVERPLRGTLSRPTVKEIYAYRHEINQRMIDFIAQCDESVLKQMSNLLVLGLNHEQQHQELLVTDLKYIFAVNPLVPIYDRAVLADVSTKQTEAEFVSFDGGLLEFGHQGDGFFYDNESPRHQAYLNPFGLMNRPVTCEEFLAFMEDGGYANNDLWLSDAWATLQERSWSAPLHWEQVDGRWRIRTLGGAREINPAEAVCHVSFYEAAAYARWSGKRLPTEYEWERAAQGVDPTGNFLESNLLHPTPASAGGGLKQMFGDVWEWTQSAYLPYPGYTRVAGALGEYNGKFMSDQMVLRGGSCATPQSHFRPTYRNFFQCDKRWQFSGFRLAEDV